MPKFPVLFAYVARDGVEGDRHTHTKYHGGLDRAICLYSEEHYAWLNAQGICVGNGDVGENFTTRGIDYEKLQVGTLLEVGDGGVVIEITKVRAPCSLLQKWDASLPKVIEGRSGWMAKVIKEGVVRPGDEIRWGA